MTKIKLEENSPEELVALFQRRGKFNTENPEGFKWQSFDGLCEITSYGKAEKNESPEKALKREMKEELGKKAAKMILKSKPVKLYETMENDGDKVFVWASLLPKEILKEIKLDISTGGIEIIRKSDLKNIKEEKFSPEKCSVKNSENITLFEIPVSAIEKAFEIFK